VRATLAGRRVVLRVVAPSCGCDALVLDVDEPRVRVTYHEPRCAIGDAIAHAAQSAGFTVDAITTSERA
jgi:hypothetical protein